VQNILKKEPLMLTLSEVLSFLCGKVGKEFAGKLASMPSWADMCRQREEAARNLKEQK
jgi:hypothetical protein